MYIHKTCELLEPLRRLLDAVDHLLAPLRLLVVLRLHGLLLVLLLLLKIIIIIIIIII